MALIPNEAALRLRLEAESQLLQPLQRVLDIPADLPELRQGQLFSARIQEALPDNTFRALVAGKSLTLSLPEGAKAGDTLELVVIDRSPRVVVARLADPAAGTAGETGGEPSSIATLSPAGRLIGAMLPAEGEPVAPLPLAKGGPLLSSPPENPALVAPLLVKVVKQSGLFYESHQAQWVAGQLPLPELLKEPQAQRSNIAQLLATANDPATEQAAWTLLQKSTVAERPETATKLPAGNAGNRTSVDQGSGNFGRPGELLPAENTGKATEPARTNSAAGTVPEDLRPILQQQLEAAANQRMAWHGEIWPRQQLSWEIDWHQGGRQDGSDEAREWHTTLSLTTPRLGEIQARLSLNPNGVAIVLRAPHAGTGNDLRHAAPALESALAAAGVPLTGLQIRDDDR